LILTRSAVNWFHQRVPYHRLLPVRASSYILSLLNPGLGQGGVAFYVHRREHIPFLALAGTMLFLVVLEVSQLALYAAIGIVAFYSHLIAAFAPFYIIFGAILGLGLWFIHRGTEPLEKLAARFARRLPLSDAFFTRVVTFLATDFFFSAHVRLQLRRNGDAAIGLLIIFHHRHQGPPDGEPRPVQGVDKTRALTAPRSATRVHAPRLERAAVGAT